MNEVRSSSRQYQIYFSQGFQTSCLNAIRLCDRKQRSEENYSDEAEKMIWVRCMKSRWKGEISTGCEDKRRKLSNSGSDATTTSIYLRLAAPVSLFRLLVSHLAHPASIRSSVTTKSLIRRNLAGHRSRPHSNHPE
jgi:hypothetical protein